MKNIFLVLLLFSASSYAPDATVGHDPTEPLSWLKPEPAKKKVVKKRQYFPSLQAISCTGSQIVMPCWMISQ